MGTASLIALLASLGMGIYNSYQSSQKMDEYRSALSARMAQNAAKQAQAESPTLSPVGQSYLTAAEGALNMCQTTMQKHVGKELINVKVAGQEKMKTQERCQINAPQLQYPRCHKSQEVDNEEVLGHGLHIIHNYSLSLFCVMFYYFLYFAGKITKNIRFLAQNQGNTHFFS